MKISNFTCFSIEKDNLYIEWIDPRDNQDQFRRIYKSLEYINQSIASTFKAILMNGRDEGKICEVYIDLVQKIIKK